MFGVEVGGRWSAEANVFLKNLAAVEARGGASLARGSGSCCLVPSLAGGVLGWVFSCSLLDVASPGGDGATPSLNAVLGEARNA